jgi:putative endonuclease
MRPTRRFTPTSQWEDARQRRGLWGERVAMAFLTSCGWQVEGHRFRLGRHDVDVVARRGPLVAFVEVKARGSVLCGTPVESVRWQKRRILGKVAALWQVRHGRPSDEYRFDVIAIQFQAGGGYTIEHLKDAWRL